MKLAFHLIMSVLLAAVLAYLRRERTRRAWSAAAGTMLLAPIGVVALAAPHPFFLMWLISALVFLYLPLFLGLSGWLMRPVWPRMAWGSLAIAGCIAAVAVDAFWIEPTLLEVTRLEFRSPKISRPVRVVVLADIQMDRFGDYEKEAFRLTLRQQPDLILLAGDYLQAPPAERLHLRNAVNAFLRTLDFHAPLGVYAVRGNVDQGNWSATFRGLPIRIVEQTETFELADLRLTCLSMSDSFNVYTELPAPPEDRFHLVLGHSPEYALGLSEADLAVAGHTHGGQIRLPLVGPLTTLSDLPRRHGAGLSDRPGGGKMFVSRGVGMERGDAPRIRFLCRPELAVIDLLPDRKTP